MLIAGADAATPVADQLQLADTMRAAGAEVDAVVYDGAPHSFFDRAFGEWAEACRDALGARPGPDRPGRAQPDRVGGEPIDPGVIELAGRVFDLARSGSTEELAAYVDAGVPVNLTNDKGDTLLILAAYHGHPETVGALLDRGADHARVNDRGQTALAAAVFRQSAARRDAGCWRRGRPRRGRPERAGDRGLLRAPGDDRLCSTPSA